MAPRANSRCSPSAPGNADGAWARFCAENLSRFLLLFHFINHKVLEFAQDQLSRHSRQLSPREAYTLSMLATGRSRGQTAVALGISEHTLRAYIESARLKLGAVNTTHAVALALTQGAIIL